MADLAEIGDVEEGRRSLRGQEIIVALDWIASSQAQLRSEVLGLDDWVAAAPNNAIVVRSRIVGAVLRKLFGTWDSPWPFTRDEIDRLIRVVAGDDGLSLPQGAFPDLVEYPVY